MTRIFRTGLIFLFLAGLPVFSQAQGFDEKSLHGNYAVIGTGGAHAAASIGTSIFDGNGHVSRSLVLNAPAASGTQSGQTRRIVKIGGEGSYSVNSDGTGIAKITNTLPDGNTFAVTLDFVIKNASVDAGNGAKLATEIFMMERETGIAAQLVTFSLYRLPD